MFHEIIAKSNREVFAKHKSDEEEILMKTSFQMLSFYLITWELTTMTVDSNNLYPTFFTLMNCLACEISGI